MNDPSICPNRTNASRFRWAKKVAQSFDYNPQPQKYQHFFEEDPNPVRIDFAPTREPRT